MCGVSLAGGPIKCFGAKQGATWVALRGMLQFSMCVYRFVFFVCLLKLFHQMNLNVLTAAAGSCERLYAFQYGCSFIVKHRSHMCVCVCYADCSPKPHTFYFPNFSKLRFEPRVVLGQQSVRVTRQSSFWDAASFIFQADYVTVFYCFAMGLLSTVCCLRCDEIINCTLIGIYWGCCFGPKLLPISISACENHQSQYFGRHANHLVTCMRKPVTKYTNIHRHTYISDAVVCC